MAYKAYPTWRQFYRLAEFLDVQGYDPASYIRAQFEVIRDGKLYPNMLASKYCEINYLKYTERVSRRWKKQSELNAEWTREFVSDIVQSLLQNKHEITALLKSGLLTKVEDAVIIMGVGLSPYYVVLQPDVRRMYENNLLPLVLSEPCRQATRKLKLRGLKIAVLSALRARGAWPL